MLKVLFVAFFSTLAASSVAYGKSCDDIGFEQAYHSVNIRQVIVCFVYTKTPAEKDRQLSRDPDGIAAYSISQSEMPTLMYEFPYAGTKGEINDAFVLSVGSAAEEMLFVIHSVETPRSWDAVSNIYDVTVMRLRRGILVPDEKLSRFFSLGGDLIDAQGRAVYIYPYKERKAVVDSVRSPLFEFVYFSTPVLGVLQEKAFLYSGDGEPSVQDPQKMYLVKGDEVTLEDSTAGWCKVSYSGKKETITRWVQCRSVAFQRVKKIM